MYAVVGQVQIDPSHGEEVRTALRETVIPLAKSMNGFAGGTWLRAMGDDTGVSVLLFESEEAARSAVERMRQGPPPGTPATFVSADVFEVIGQA
jgi:Antibiotic biosynthesis monooxygenase